MPVPRPSGTVDSTTVSTALNDRIAEALADCVIIDCETTGLHPQDDRIIEVAALRLCDGKAVDQYHCLVDPGTPLPAIITELTGLTDSRLGGRPCIDEILDDIAAFAGTESGRTVVGHNVSFDISFINGEYRRHRGEDVLDPGRSLCTAETARQLLPRAVVGRYRLDTLADVLALDHRPAHRAVADVYATADLLAHLSTIAH